ncbi:MAG: caspase family protein [Ignavibacteriae bacterium]|nr:caspase family protein [Ignavibacteriota bacterium]
MDTQSLHPNYNSSHALVIGINSYPSAPPLRYAVNDAIAVSELLKNQFGFSESNIHLLLDEKATHDSIIDSFMSFTSQGTVPDDRLLFFFAGHGFTIRSRRGDVGYFLKSDMENYEGQIQQIREK